MTTEQWERRYACALGMAIYIHLTNDNLLLTFLGLASCMLFASLPAIQKWWNERGQRNST